MGWQSRSSSLFRGCKCQTSEVEDRFSEALLDGTVEKGEVAVVSLDKALGHLVIHKKILEDESAPKEEQE